jgi:hypothetical protein
MRLVGGEFRFGSPIADVPGRNLSLEDSGKVFPENPDRSGELN